MAQREQTYVTVEEWRALEQTNRDGKHEYIDGQIYAMTGGTLSHGRLGSNTVRAIEDALVAAEKSCYVYNSDVAVRVSPTRHTYPDTSISCDEQDRPTPDKVEVKSPRVIVEVLSDTTEAYDRGRKFAFYRACPTMQEYVLVDAKYQAVEVHRRTAKGWTASQFYESNDEIELVSLGVHFSMAALYKNTGVPETADEPDRKI